MRRLAAGLLFALSSVSALAQTVSQTAPSSDAQAVLLAQKTVTALSGGTAISDVTLNANVISILGSDNETGTGTFIAKGNDESRIDLTLSGGTRSDIRTVTSGRPDGTWQKNNGISTAYAQHNCWTDAAWFSPALSSLSQTANSSFIFKYIGQEQRGGVNVEHIQVYQPAVGQQLSTVDFYVDPVSYLPLASAFNTHADDDMNTNIPVEVDFANFQLVSGGHVPFHFQKMLNGGVVIDATITSVAINTGLPDSLFALQ